MALVITLPTGEHFSYSDSVRLILLKRNKNITFMYGGKNPIQTASAK